MSLSKEMPGCAAHLCFIGIIFLQVKISEHEIQFPEVQIRVDIYRRLPDVVQK